MCVHPIRLTTAQPGERVPCGFCIECRGGYARGWAIRCWHEAQLHECVCAGVCVKPLEHGGSCFGTLTYDDDHLPEHGSLEKREFQLFMKRLRQFVLPRKVRFYGAGEYGDRTCRPHYHFLVFGYMPNDRCPLGVSKGFPLYSSSELGVLWQMGMSSVGEVSFGSASYVARYVMKKVDQVGKKKKYSCDPETGDLHEIEPEFSTMSRRRGLGHGWYEKFGEEVARLDSVVVAGKELMPPRYYDDLLRARDAAAYEVMKLRRERKAASDGKTYTEAKMARMAREVIARQRLEEAQRRL